MVFENGVLRRIFGPMLVEAMGDWRTLYTEDHNIFGVNTVLLG